VELVAEEVSSNEKPAKVISKDTPASVISEYYAKELGGHHL
jgi:hypothetical protein